MRTCECSMRRHPEYTLYGDMYLGRWMVGCGPSVHWSANASGTERSA